MSPEEGEGYGSPDLLLANYLSRNGTDKSGPIMDALMCECPLPSCQRFSCS